MGYWLREEQVVIQMDERPVYVVMGWTRDASEAALRSQIKRVAAQLKEDELFWLDTLAAGMLTKSLGVEK